MFSDLTGADLEATRRDKLLFLTFALPLVGALGTWLRLSAGMSQQTTLLVIYPLMGMGFFAWHLSIAIKRARRRAAENERPQGRPIVHRIRSRA